MRPVRSLIAAAALLLAACGTPDPVPPMVEPGQPDPPLPVVEPAGPEGLPPAGDTIRRPDAVPRPPAPPPAPRPPPPLAR
jgi:hypothetical protein